MPGYPTGGTTPRRKDKYTIVRPKLTGYSPLVNKAYSEYVATCRIKKMPAMSKAVFSKMYKKKTSA